MAIAVAFLLLLLASPAAYAANYVVGGTSGWNQGVDYSTWAQGKTFNVGDTLLFTYGSTHRVDEVSESDYTSCASGNALSTHNDGNTTITLSKAGSMYFICPTAGHCASGQKLAVSVVSASGTVSAVNYIVGDTSGWTQGVDYGTWAQGKTFNVGDTLLFTYGSTHKVDEVSESDYTSCATANALSTHSDGNTTITLSKAGSMYFICPTAGHCTGGMKLAVSVVSASGTPSPSSPPPPSSSTTPSRSTTPPPSTPSPTNYYYTSAGASGLVVGFLLLLGSGLTIMG
ncbi:hypothetical protein SLE2022_025300 [Rubroshorea leprosula]